MKKKIVFFAVYMLAATTICFSQDIILKTNGEEVKAKVTEVGTNEIKYKKTDNESGPTYTISKQDVFMVKYADGTNEVIERQNHVTTSSSTSVYFNKDYKKNAFGLDLGVGSREKATELELGLRWLHNFSPYVGWDILNVKVFFPTKDLFMSYPEDYLYQGMSGVRGYTPAFYKNMKGYASFNLGYGYIPVVKGKGFAYGFELGMHLTRTIFMGFAYNHQGGSFDIEIPTFNSKGTRTGTKTEKADLSAGYAGFRLGFNF